MNSIREETRRQAVHMLVGMFALLLRWLTYPQALACAVAAMVFNAFILPRLPGSTQSLYRAEEQERGFSRGILLYPVAVFLLIFVFPVPVAASMWGMLSFGDGLATLAGSRANSHRLPWNRTKSFEGFLAFVAGAGPSAALLYWWTLPNVASSPMWWRSSRTLSVFGSAGIGRIAIICLAVAVVCAFLESLETWLDDNLLVPLGGACVMVGLLYAFAG